MSKNRKVSLIDYDRLFDEAIDPKFLNDMLLNDTGKSVIDMLFQAAENSLEYAPKCSCDAYKGKLYEGHVCPFCGTVIVSDFTSNFVPVNWVRIPDGLPSILHPRFYILLSTMSSKHITTKRGSKTTGKKQRVPVIDFILNPELDMPDELAAHIHGQGFTYFCEHMDEIIHFLLNEYPPIVKNPESGSLWNLYLEEKEKLIIRKLPLLHPSFHPLQVKGKSKTIDKTSDIVLPAILDLANAEFVYKRTVTRKYYADKEVWKVFSKYIQYIKTIMEVKLGDKHALIRRHCVAGRIFWTARSVLAPMTERHDGDEVHLPWNIAMYGLQLEIINLLCNRHGYTPTAAVTYFFEHVHKHSPLLESIFKTLIRECEYKGIPIAMGRNPTLLRTSIRLQFVTHVDPNPTNKTIHASQRIYTGFNAKKIA